MNTTNMVIVSGRVGAEPRIYTNRQGVKMAWFSIAANESWKDKNGEWQEKTTWVDIQAMAYQAERVEKSVTKGAPVLITGKLHTYKKEREDGSSSNETVVTCKTLEVYASANTNYANSNSNNFGSNQAPMGGLDGEPAF